MFVLRPVENFHLYQNVSSCRWNTTSLVLCLALMSKAVMIHYRSNACYKKGRLFLWPYSKDSWCSLVNAERLVEDRSLPMFTSWVSRCNNRNGPRIHNLLVSANIGIIDFMWYKYIEKDKVNLWYIMHYTEEVSQIFYFSSILESLWYIILEFHTSNFRIFQLWVSY